VDDLQDVELLVQRNLQYAIALQQEKQQTEQEAKRLDAVKAEAERQERERGDAIARPNYFEMVERLRKLKKSVGFRLPTHMKFNDVHMRIVVSIGSRFPLLKKPAHVVEIRAIPNFDAPAFTSTLTGTQRQQTQAQVIAALKALMASYLAKESKPQKY
jgi:hypothetical protein